MTMRWLTLALLVVSLISADRSDAQQVLNPRYGNGSYVIGPYPVPFEVEGVKATIWVSLVFTPEVLLRHDPPFKLTMQAKAELTELGPAIRSYAVAKYSQDNCGRINAVDNWVYDIGNPKVTVVDSHTLRIKSRVDVSTWTCTEGVPELVCEGLSCKLRPTKIKIQNFEQGGEIRKDLWIDVKPDKILYKDYEPEIDIDNNTVLQNMLNDGFKTILKVDEREQNNKLLPVSAIDAATPAEFKALHPQLEFGGFETYKDRPFLTFTYSVSINQSQINDFMSKYFGSLYTPFTGYTPPPSEPYTKARLRADCAPYMAQHPGATIQECAAMMGMPYESLPD
jgi:hypothetical protein